MMRTGRRIEEVPLLRTLFKVLSVYWLFKAAMKGPRALGSYMVRRTARRAVNRGLRKVR